MDKPGIPSTRTQKGRAWATATLLTCGVFSLYANVRSGQLYRDSVIVSVLPPVVAFLSSHLISYFSPRTKWTKAFVYGGFGLICLFAMYGSGWHIVDFVTKAGQHWTTAIIYVFITDAPMLLAAGILIERVSTTRTTTTKTEPVKATEPAKKATPVKAVAKPQTTPVPPKPATKRTSRAKAAATQEPDKPAVPDILLDPFEKDMLRA